MNRIVIAIAAAIAVAGCKKNEPVVAAPVAPPAGGAPAMPPPSMPPQGAMPPAGMPPGGMPGGGAMPVAPGGAALEQRIALGKQIVAKDPKNVQAWIALGNDYFDSRQFQASVDAYQNALQLDPRNPDVLTDQGVMYKELGQYDKAVANFLKANQIAPDHMQSLYNAGVVYAFDLNQPKKAEEVWLKVIANDKSGRFAAQAGSAIAEMRQRTGQAGPAVPAPAR